MKIALLSSGSGSHGGGEIYLQLLAKGLLRAGNVVHAIIPDKPAMDELAGGFPVGVEIHRPHWRTTYDRPFRSLGATIDVAQQRIVGDLVRGIAPDIVHVNQQVAEDGLDLIIGACGSGAPFVSTIHVARSATVLGARFGRLRDVVSRSVLARWQGIHIAVADRARQELLTWLRPRDGGNYLRVWNGVAQPAAEAVADARLVARREWGVDDDVLVIGCVGRIQPQKNPEFALRVASGLKARGAPIHFVWIGDGPLKEMLQKQSEEMEIAGSVTFDGWRRDAALRVAGLDLLLMPSRFEGLPLALLEAMHAGVAVAARDVDGIGEAIVNDVSGILCSGESPADWCHQLERIIASLAERTRLGRAAQQRARTHFSIDAMTAATQMVYERGLQMHRDSLMRANRR